MKFQSARCVVGGGLEATVFKLHIKKNHISAYLAVLTQHFVSLQLLTVLKVNQLRQNFFCPGLTAPVLPLRCNPTVKMKILISETLLTQKSSGL